jgi:hypothetical protein
MASVLAGSRIRVEGAGAALVARSLRTVVLDGGWTVPLLADAAGLQAAGGPPLSTIVEFPTDAGPLRLDAELIHEADALVLRAPGLRTAAFNEQRRENVRGLVHLSLRGTLLGGSAPASRDGGPADGGPADGGPADSGTADLTGVTASISAGGLSADIGATGWLAPGSRIYVELSMPGGDLAPAVLSVLEYQAGRVRARFIDISPLDRERLVRLVFARQRAELAERRRGDELRGTP